MESGKSMDSYLHKARGSEHPCSNVLEIKIAELFRTKEDLEKAKDDATQSWLDSRPLIDELEKLQTDLANEKDRATKSNTVVLELETRLENTRISIRSRKAEEVKIREMIDQINQSSDKLRKEIEQFKLETDEERRARSKLKQVLRLRKQTLRTVQLTLTAIRIESEAFGASSVKALHHISCSETNNGTVQLTQEEYNALTSRAQEETSLADWRVSLAMEQRLLAEKNRELAQRSLQEQYKDNRSRKKKIKDEINGNENTARQEDDSRIEVGDQVNSRRNTFPTARAKLIAKSRRNPQLLKRSKSINKRTTVQEKKPSIFVQIRSFFVHKITFWFG